MKEIYCKGVVIANGVPDSDGDILNKKQIKQIFTKYNRDTDIMHSYIKIDGVDVIGSWISETPTKINGKDVPDGSWLCICKITNNDVIRNIHDGKLNGYSLGSVPVDVTTDKYWFINKSRNYSDYEDIENLKPLFISIVDHASNGYSFEVMFYEEFINKNKENGDKMAEDKPNDEMISVTGLEKIAKIFGINKSKTEKKIEEPKPTKKEDEDISNKELLDSIKSEVATGVVEGLTAFAKKNAEKEDKKPSNDDKKDEKDDKSDKKTEEPPKDDKTGDKKPTKTKEEIDKQKTNKMTKKTETLETPNVDTSFYKRTKRDAFGCKIRQ